MFFFFQLYICRKCKLFLCFMLCDCQKVMMMAIKVRCYDKLIYFLHQKQLITSNERHVTLWKISAHKKYVKNWSDIVTLPRTEKWGILKLLNMNFPHLQPRVKYGTYPGCRWNKYARKEIPTILRNVNIVRNLVLNGHNPLKRDERV